MESGVHAFWFTEKMAGRREFLIKTHPGWFIVLQLSNEDAQ
jgi:hypothetical protein